MSFRRGIFLLVLALGSLLCAGNALAIKVDRELEEILATKVHTDQLPLLLIYDDPEGADGMVQDLDKMDPKKRRKKTIAYLKRKNLKAQKRVADILAANQGPDVGLVRQLYLAGAIAFTGTPKVVEELAALPDPATLFFDRSYELGAGTALNKRMPQVLRPASADTAWSIKYIGADRVWRELGLTGRGVVVGHIDTGVWLSHPDLADRLWVNEDEIPGNGLDDDGNGFVDDVHGYDFGVDDGDPNDDAPNGGHGTHTAGTVVGDGSGGLRTGTAPGARIMACKLWQADGQGGTLGMIWAAEQYCVENGARIITMSLGIPGDIPAIFMRNDRQNCNNIRDAGVLLVNSAGNEHGIGFPPAQPPLEVDLTGRVPAPWSALPVPYSSTGGVLTVGATGYKGDGVYPLSSRGPVDWGQIEPWLDWDFAAGSGLIKPDISAPGTNINSTVAPDGYSGDTWSGTSMACPQVAAVAALMLEKNPSLSPAGLDSLLEKSAVDRGLPGKDNTYGSGRLDAWAAVNAVPEALTANLNLLSILPDFDDDQVLDPGQTSPVAFTLVNVSPVADATGVTATLVVVEDPFVSVVDGSGTFTDIPAGGAKGDNRADPFRLAVDPAAPQGHPFTLLLTIEAGDFSRTFDMDWYVGLPEYRTHAVGAVYLTVTDQGSLGYMGQDGAQGQGMGLIGEPSSLFIGSFWAGTGPDFVCNRDYDGLGEETSEWVVSTDKDDVGRVHDESTGGERQVFRSVFHDGGHATPLPLRVEQTSLALPTEANEDFVILQYTLTNEGDEPLEGLRLGVFSDFDVADDGNDLGMTDAQRRLAWIFHGQGPCYGVALLDSLAEAHTTLIDNQTFVYAESRINDQDKFDLLDGTAGSTVARNAGDWSLLVSTRVNLAPMASRTVAFAMLYGADAKDLQLNTDAALAAYLAEGPLTPEVPVHVARLDQNRPNPFNPLTTIAFEVPTAGPIELAVYDLRGVKVRTLLRGDHAAGPDAITWDGANDAGRPLPSGIYLYRLTTGPSVQARKMTLVR